MKKSNIILLAIAVIASAFLLYLWFYLGFNKVDNPVDIAISVIWWAIVAAAAALIARAEKRRQKAVRTVLIGEGRAYNPEAGAIAIEGSPVDEIEAIVSKLEYGFGRQQLPEDAPEAFDYVVRSDTYRADGDSVDWSGEVVNVETGNSVRFGSRAELAEILAA